MFAEAYTSVKPLGLCFRGRFLALLANFSQGQVTDKKTLQLTRDTELITAVKSYLVRALV